MKKQALLLSVLGALTLTGCSFEDLMFWKKKADKGEATVELPENFLREFGDYKLATKVKDGGRYLLGVYRKNEDLIRFANGDYHRDSNGYYPYYMNTVAATTEGAAEFEVKMVGDNEFTIQVFAEGQVWHEKYVAAYPATSKYGKSVLSLALLDSPDQAQYIDPTTGNKYTALYSTFKFYTTYEDMPAYAPACPLQYPDVDDEPTPKFMGTGHVTQQDLDEGKSDYTSIDCNMGYSVALDAESYDLAHFYEKK